MHNTIVLISICVIIKNNLEQLKTIMSVEKQLFYEIMSVYHGTNLTTQRQFNL